MTWNPGGCGGRKRWVWIQVIKQQQMPWTNRWLHRRDSNEQLTQPTRTQHTLLNGWFHKIYASCTSSIQHVWTPTPNTPGSGGVGVEVGGLAGTLTTAFCCRGLKLSRAHLQLTKGISVGSQLLPRPRAGLCGFVSACYGGKVTETGPSSIVRGPTLFFSSLLGSSPSLHLSIQKGPKLK